MFGFASTWKSRSAKASDGGFSDDTKHPSFALKLSQWVMVFDKKKKGGGTDTPTPYVITHSAAPTRLCISISVLILSESNE